MTLSFFRIPTVSACIFFYIAKIRFPRITQGGGGTGGGLFVAISTPISLSKTSCRYIIFKRKPGPYKIHYQRKCRSCYFLQKEGVIRSNREYKGWRRNVFSCLAKHDCHPLYLFGNTITRIRTGSLKYDTIEFYKLDATLSNVYSYNFFFYVIFQSFTIPSIFPFFFF